MTRHWLAATLAATGLSPALAAQQYPTRPPEAAPLAPAPFPPFHETVLPNGVRLLVVENHRLPILSASLSFSAGKVVDPPGKEGLGGMVAGLLTKGAGKRTAEEISAAIEGVGGSLEASAGADVLTLRGGVLSSDAGLLFELLADAVIRPAFPTKEIELLRTQTLSELQLELSQPEALADAQMMRALYGQHPYARRPTPASVRAIGRDDLVRYQHERLRPTGALLVVAGDITLAQVRRYVMQAFRGWLGAPSCIWRRSATSTG